MLFKIYKELFNKTALIVDDHEVNLITYSYLLEKQKIRTIQASSGKEALAILKQTTDIDIIIMDMYMPDMDGFATMQAIRSDDLLMNIPIIAVTAKKGIREKCLACGANEYIVKPLDNNNLMPIMIELLSKGTGYYAKAA
jgi:CheY-like chemotaxis protein